MRVPISRRSTRFVLRDKIKAFTSSFDTAFTSKNEFEDMVNWSNAPSMIYSSSNPFIVFTKSSYTTEKNLMIEIQTALDACICFEVDYFALVASQYKIADTVKNERKNLPQ